MSRRARWEPLGSINFTARCDEPSCRAAIAFSIPREHHKGVTVPLTTLYAPMVELAAADDGLRVFGIPDRVRRGKSWSRTSRDAVEAHHGLALWDVWRFWAYCHACGMKQLVDVRAADRMLEAQQRLQP